MPLKYPSIIGPLIELAKNAPDKPAIYLVMEDGSKETFTASGLYKDTLRFGTTLTSMGIGSGDVIFLTLRHSSFLLSTLFGSIYIGAIPAVLPYPTDRLDPVTYIERLKVMVTHADARFIITLPTFRDALQKSISGTTCRVIDSNEILSHLPSSNPSASKPSINKEAIAVLQYSSGTTVIQKGIGLTHRSIFRQIAAFRERIAVRSDDVIVVWAPLFNDMGLVASLFLSIVESIPLVLLSPFGWVRNPKILFQAIHEYRGTLSWMPNFAFQHSVSSVMDRDMSGIDLSSLRALVNGGEPALHVTMQKFLIHFSRWGFKESALAAAYGSTENTSAFTITPLGKPPKIDWVDMVTLQQDKKAMELAPHHPGSIPIVSCGSPLNGAEIRIIGDKGRIMPDRQVGEIVVRADFMFAGYYCRPDITAQVVEKGWYSTGDIGYLVQDELYVCGRKNDVIITGGKNIFPHDIESIANRVDGIRPGRSVAFGSLDENLGTERIILVAELRKNVAKKHRAAIEKDLRKRVVQELDVALSEVHFHNERWVIKSSSGKMARAANKEKYEREHSILTLGGMQ